MVFFSFQTVFEKKQCQPKHKHGDDNIKNHARIAKPGRCALLTGERQGAFFKMQTAVMDQGQNKAAERQTVHQQRAKANAEKR
jgi:hypothetical protein